jgi:hypothetical protein
MENVVSVELDEWLSEQEAAAAIKKSVRTLRDWRRKGAGPPYAYFGRSPRYRTSTLIEHFRASEIEPVREHKRTRQERAAAINPNPRD